VHLSVRLKGNLTIRLLAVKGQCALYIGYKVRTIDLIVSLNPQPEPLSHVRFSVVTCSAFSPEKINSLSSRPASMYLTPAVVTFFGIVGLISPAFAAPM
jgi:hypothetical protein